MARLIAKLLLLTLLPVMGNTACAVKSASPFASSRLHHIPLAPTPAIRSEAADAILAAPFGPREVVVPAEWKVALTQRLEARWMALATDERSHIYLRPFGADMPFLVDMGTQYQNGLYRLTDWGAREPTIRDHEILVREIEAELHARYGNGLPLPGYGPLPGDPTPGPGGGSGEAPHFSWDEMTRWRGDFLAVDVPECGAERGKWSTLLLFGRWGDTRFPGCVDAVILAHKSRGYTHVSVYAFNEHDFGGVTSFNGYDRADAFEDMLRYLAAAGLRTEVFLNPDDAPAWNRDSAQRLPGIWAMWIPRMRPWVAGFVVGLEQNEYWSACQQIDLTNYLTSASIAGDRPVWNHFTPGRWAGYPVRSSDPKCSSDRGRDEYDYWRLVPRAAGLVLQYEQKDRNAAGIKRRTDEVGLRMAQQHGDIGGARLLIAGEYAYPGDSGVTESKARSLGREAMKSRFAHGFANGG